MKASEIKARISSLLDIPPTDIILTKDEKATPSFTYEEGKFTITYSDPNTLVHEFLHACFTSRELVPDSLINALEDYRISVKAYEYDKKLGKANTDIMSEEQYYKTIRKVKHEDPLIQDSIKTMLAIATPYPIPNDKLEEILKKEIKSLGEKDLVIQQALEARTSMADYPGKEQVSHWDENLRRYLRLPPQERKGNADSVGCDMSLKMTKEQLEKRIKDNIQVRAATTIKRLSATEEFVLKKGLRKILQNRAIQKSYNTTKGKLYSKKLGNYPNPYLFREKQKPGQRTVLYLMVDLSGSMNGGRLDAVSAFMNSIRSFKLKDLTIELRGFNTGYFKNNEVPEDYRELIRNCQCATDPYTHYCLSDYNDDAHYLNEILKEIEAEPCANKALLILSDGQPAPSGKFEITKLKSIVNRKLVPSDIPYMSIGIMCDSVTKYYPKAKVVNDTTELVAALSKYSRELIKF